MTISLSWSVTSQLRSREFPLTARRKSESESKQRIRETEMGLLQTGPRLERRGGEYENGVEREEERVNLRARVRESRGSLAGTARACISSRPVTPLYGTRTEPVAFHRCSCWDLHRRCQATAQWRHRRRHRCAPPPSAANRRAMRWRGWYIKSGRFSRVSSPRFDAIGSFWIRRGVIGIVYE